MIKLIVGLKGTGKTKTLIADVNKAAEESKGSVVCIEYGRKLNYEIKPQARLIDAMEFDVTNEASLYGFVCGILSQNYDIAHIFVDSITKIVNDDMAALENFLNKISVVAEQNNAEIQIILSMNPDDASDGIKKYVK